MKKQNIINALHKPVSPIISVAAVIGVVLLTSLLLLTKHAGNNSSNRRPIVTYSTPTPTLTPVPVDTSTWKTYKDWKYNYSIILPPEFASYFPGKGLTANDPDPEGSGEMDFEDTQITKPNAKYSFYVRTIANNNHLNNNCSTDQECYNKLYSFYKGLPYTKIYLLDTMIPSKVVKGLAVEHDSSDPQIFPEVDEYYNFAIRGKPFELNIHSAGTYDQLIIKQPIIDTIVFTISFSQ